MFSEELVIKIKKLYSEDKETMKKLLDGDEESIRKLAYNYKFTPDEIIDAYEQGKIEELYKSAQRQKEIFKLYHELCLEYSNHEDQQKKL